MGYLGLKKREIDKPETIKTKSPKTVTLFFWESENSKKLNLLDDCYEVVNLNIW